MTCNISTTYPVTDSTNDGLGSTCPFPTLLAVRNSTYTDDPVALLRECKMALMQVTHGLKAMSAVAKINCEATLKGVDTRTPAQKFVEDARRTDDLDLMSNVCDSIFQGLSILDSEDSNPFPFSDAIRVARLSPCFDRVGHEGFVIVDGTKVLGWQSQLDSFKPEKAGLVAVPCSFPKGQLLRCSVLDVIKNEAKWVSVLPDPAIC